MEEIQAVAVGTGHGGAMPTGEVVGVTPQGQPNVAVTIITPLAAVTIRFIHQYLLTISGIVTAGLALGTTDPTDMSKLVHYKDFADLVYKSAQFSLTTPALGLLKDLITIFGRLEQKFPFLTGNV